jgi:hypothetical protein
MAKQGARRRPEGVTRPAEDQPRPTSAQQEPREVRKPGIAAHELPDGRYLLAYGYGLSTPPDA